MEVYGSFESFVKAFNKYILFEGGTDVGDSFLCRKNFSFLLEKMCYETLLYENMIFVRKKLVLEDHRIYTVCGILLGPQFRFHGFCDFYLWIKCFSKNNPHLDICNLHSCAKI